MPKNLQCLMVVYDFKIKKKHLGELEYKETFFAY